MKIRSAIASDAEAIARVHVNVWRSTYTGLVSSEYLDGLSVQKREDMWKKVLNDIEAGRSSHMLFVATVDSSEVIGFIDGGKPRNSPAFDCELYAIYIDERVQRQGVGLALVLKLCQSFLESGLKNMIVWALKGNDSTRFYERIDGRLINELKPITIGNQECVCVGYEYDILKLAEKLKARVANSNRLAAN